VFQGKYLGLPDSFKLSFTVEVGTLGRSTLMLTFFPHSGLFSIGFLITIWHEFCCLLSLSASLEDLSKLGMNFSLRIRLCFMYFSKRGELDMWEMFETQLGYPSPNFSTLAWTIFKDLFFAFLDFLDRMPLVFCDWWEDLFEKLY
jgi:hypothetical protein